MRLSKRQHQKQLQTARAKRQADRLQRKQQRARIGVLVVAVLVIASMVGAGLVFGGGEPTAPEIDDVEASLGDEDAAATADVDPCPPADDAPEVDSTVYDAAPGDDLDADAAYTATMATTCGDITMDLDVAGAPGAVANLVGLAEDGYFDGVLFHRVIDGFVIQAGDPAGTGCGQAECSAEGFDPDADMFPGYTIPDEDSAAADFEVDAATGRVQYPRGTVAMARTEAPDSTGSQFFVVQGDPVLLPDASYIVVGTVTDGMDVVDQIAGQPTGELDRLVDDVRIVSFTVSAG